jgi:hypothetical protein
LGYNSFGGRSAYAGARGNVNTGGGGGSGSAGGSPPPAVDTGGWGGAGGSGIVIIKVYTGSSDIPYTP